VLIVDAIFGLFEDGPNDFPVVVRYDELVMHNSAEDYWVIYYDTVDNVTGYADKYPVGSDLIVRDWGQNGTDHSKEYHNRSLIVLIGDRIVGLFQEGPDDFPKVAPPNGTSTLVQLQ
jgi:cytochrome b involved in lipid metabolism